MFIIESEKIEKIKRKLAKLPEVRQLTVTEEGNLLVTGNKQFIFPNYVIASPRGNFFRISGKVFSTENEGPKEFPIGLISERKLLLNTRSEQRSFVAPNSPSQDGEVFLLLILTERFCEFYYADKNLSTPLRIVLSPDKMEAVLGLAITLLQIQDKEVADQIKECLEREGV